MIPAFEQVIKYTLVLLLFIVSTLMYLQYALRLTLNDLCISQIQVLGPLHVFPYCSFSDPPALMYFLNVL